jgi:hypothetical protein
VKEAKVLHGPQHQGVSQSEWKVNDKLETMRKEAVVD